MSDDKENAKSKATKEGKATTKPKKTELKLDAAALKVLPGKLAKPLSRYAAILFFLLVAGTYAFVILRINTLSNAQPSQSDVDTQTSKTPIPRIDPTIAEQLEKLKDNSQNVQTLFEQARQNPFE
jgi:hypothetical protein